MLLGSFWLLTTSLSPESNMFDTVFTLIRLLVTCGVVLVAAYYTTKWVAGVRYKRVGASGLRILDAISVGNQSSVQLVKVGERCVLIGVTRERITMLAEIPKSEIENEAKLEMDLDSQDGADTQNKPTFERYFEKFFKS